MRSAAVIIKNNQILLIHRFRNGDEYYVIPGGTVEEGESTEGSITISSGRGKRKDSK